jgi:hypothetical protein
MFSKAKLIVALLALSTSALFAQQPADTTQAPTPPATKQKGPSNVYEVLFDVLQDSNSPYEDWAPFVSIGVGVGF